MRKALIGIVLVASSVLISRAPAQPGEGMNSAQGREKYVTLGLAGGFFFAQDAVFREIYGQNMPFLSPQVSLRFPLEGRHGVDLSLGARFLQGKGKTSYTEEETSLRMQSLSLSGCYSFEARKFSLFLGPGLDMVMYKETYAETFPVDSVKGQEVGFHVVAGGFYHLAAAFSIKGYVKYCLSETKSPGFRVNLGGTEWGLGFVYRFYF